MRRMIASSVPITRTGSSSVERELLVQGASESSSLVVSSNQPHTINAPHLDSSYDRLCGLVVRVPAYRSRDLPALPHFSRSNGSGMGSTHPGEDN
jgi:hypothetical protein